MIDSAEKYISEKRLQGIGDDQIRKNLMNEGHDESNIDAAFDAANERRTQASKPPTTQFKKNIEPSPSLANALSEMKNEAAPIPAPAPSATFHSSPYPPSPAGPAPVTSSQVAPSSLISNLQTESDDDDRPVPVVHAYSTYGMEYVIMFLSLGVAAISWGTLLHGIIDVLVKGNLGVTGEFINPYAVSALAVSFPIFAFLFLRLAGIEETHPTLLRDASRRRGMQIVLVVSFLIGLSKLIGYIYSLINTSSIADDAAGYLSFYSQTAGVSDSQSAIGDFLHLLITLAIAGSIFGYYWFKLHRKSTQ